MREGFHHNDFPDIEDARTRLAGKELSAREREAVMAVIRFGGNAAAAADMGVTEQTIKNMLSSAYAKLNVYSIGQAAYDLWLADLWGEGAGPRGEAVVPPPTICEHPSENWEDRSDGWGCGICGVAITRRSARWPRRTAA